MQSDCRDCSLVVEIAVGLRRLQLDCWDCSWIAEIAVGLLRLQRFCNLHIRLVIPPRVGEVAWYRIAILFCDPNQSLYSNCNSRGLQSDCWDCTLIVEIALWKKVRQLTYIQPPVVIHIRNIKKLWLPPSPEHITYYLKKIWTEVIHPNVIDLTGQIQPIVCVWQLCYLDEDLKTNILSSRLAIKRM